MRLGVYQDGPFHVLAGRLAPHPVDAPFFRFIGGVAEDFESLTVFARIAPADGGNRPVILPAETQVVPLPGYGSLRNLPGVLGAGFRTAAAFWRGLSRVDLVWAFGPHPFEVLLVLLALLRGKRVAIGVRQDTPAYFRARLPSRRWGAILPVVDALDGLHRMLARRVPTTVVGEANARRYSNGRNRLIVMAPSLVRATDVVAEPPDRDWTAVVDLLTVGRIDSEKNPSLLLDAMAELERRRAGRYRLRWVGVGPLADDVRKQAASLGIGDRVELVGYVPFGPELLALYRGSHAFVHVSLTEGLPQVLVEAFASGTPVVATDVGGVRSGVDGGRAAVLVPPSDLNALVSALIRISDDAELRSHLAARGLEIARGRTLEAEAARVAAFLRTS